MTKFEIPKDIAIRTLGLAMMAFPVGMGVGAVFIKDWFVGGLMAFGASLLTVITILGVVLAWYGKASAKDIQEAFRTATSKAGEDNDLVQETIQKAKDK